jgi:hypothetical protein
MSFLSLEELKDQLSCLLTVSLAARDKGDLQQYEFFNQICRLLTLSIQLKEGTINSHERINKAWHNVENINSAMNNGFSETDKEHFVKSFLYDVFSIIREHYQSDPSIQPKVRLSKINLNQLTGEEHSLIKKYRDSLSGYDLECPVCITEMHKEIPCLYYFDLKTILCFFIKNMLPANLQVEGLGTRTLDELFSLLQVACEGITKPLSLVNPVTGNFISPSSINLVEDDYFALLKNLEEKYPLHVEKEPIQTYKP